MHPRPLHFLPMLALLAACVSEPPPPPPPAAYIVIMPEPCDPDQDPGACAYAAPAPDDPGDYGGDYSTDYSTPSLPFVTGAPVVVAAPARPARPPAHPAPPPKPKPIKPTEPVKPCPRNSKACPLVKLRSWAPP